MDATSSNGTFDPTRRRLCPDGACVGIIDADGRCGECGRTEAQAALGDEPAARAVPDVDAAPEGVAAESGGFDSKRRLCDDGACVGVVGADGLCAVCGRRAQ